MDTTHETLGISVYITEYAKKKQKISRKKKEKNFLTIIQMEMYVFKIPGWARLKKIKELKDKKVVLSAF